MTFTDTWPTLLAKLSLVFSPVLVIIIMDYIASVAYGVSPGGDAVSIAVIFALLIDAPVIAVVGIFFTSLTRSRSNANYLSLFGYALPAVIIWGYIVINNLPSGQ